MREHETSPSLEAWDPGGLMRAQLPEPPLGHNAQEWEKLADTIPAQVCPPEEFAKMPSGWQALLASGEGRAWYVLAWESVGDPETETETEASELSLSKTNEAAEAPTQTKPERELYAWEKPPVAPEPSGGGLGRAWRRSGLTLEQEYVRSDWQSNTGKGMVKVVLALPLLAYALYASQRGSILDIVIVGVAMSWLLLPAIYLLRHVPTKSRAARCESCGALWGGRRLCSSCKRVVRNPEGTPALRRAWRSL